MVPADEFVLALINLGNNLYNKGLLQEAFTLYENNEEYILLPSFKSKLKVEFLLSFGDILVTATYMENLDIKRVDSCFNKCEKILLETKSTQSARFLLLKGMCSYYSFSLKGTENALKDARNYVSQAMDLFGGDDATKYLAQAWTYQGLIFEGEANVDQAEKSYLKAYQIARKETLKIEMSFASRYLGLLRMKQNRDEDALNYLKESLKLREDTGFKLGIPFSMLSLGDIYIKLNDVHKALKCYKFGYEFGQGIKNSLCEMIGALSVGQCYIRLDEFDKADTYLQTAIKFAEKLENSRFLELAKKTLEIKTVD